MGSTTRGRRLVLCCSVTFCLAGALAPAAGATTPVLTVPGISVNEGAATTGTVATFHDGAGTGATGYTGTVDWGDGTTEPATMTGPPGGTLTVAVPASTHTYEGGHYTLTVTISDNDDTAHPGHGTGTASVADAPLTATAPSGLTLAEGGPIGVPLAHFTDADPGGTPAASAYRANVAWGDGTTSPAIVTGSGGAAGYDVSVANHGAPEEGSHAIVIAITDAGGATARVTVHAVVLDAPLSGVPVDAAAVKGRGRATFAAPVASFSDADPGAVASDYTGEITWGDGSASAASIRAGAGGTFIASGAHSFTRSGSFTVTTIVEDAGGQTVRIRTPLRVTVTPRARCVVPKLHGLSLKAARAALEKAHCAIGKIHRHGRHASVVRSQHVAPGTRGPAGTRVSVTLGPAAKH